MRRLSVLLVALSLAACSSSPSEPGQRPTAAEPGVFDNCVAFATQLCADAQGCCQNAYGDFSAEGCLDSFKRTVCHPGADAVTAGRATFDEGAVDDCLEAHAAAHAVCTPTWPQTLELRKKINSACRVLNGTIEPGGRCGTAADCRAPNGAVAAECVKNVCTLVEILAEGAECPFPSGSVSVCDDGLACDAPGLGTSGHCVPAVATGEGCDASVLEGTDCGLGNFCDPVTAQCKLTTNMGGSGCAQSNECVSFDCNRLANECAPAPAVLSRTTCVGTTATP